MVFRFVHTADIHLDSPLKSLALRDPALSARVGTATREAFRGIIDLCLREAVDALLIAGDLYDGAQTSMKTAQFLLAEFARLDATGIASFVIRGNHDAASKITRELVLPAAVTVFGSKATHRVIERGAMRVAIHGISFAQPVAPDSLLPRFAAPVAGAVNIGLMHSSLGGAIGHDPYAPCSLADLQATGFAYWALGHIHRRSVHAGAVTVVMPGMPQGRDIGEAGPKSVTLATIAEDGQVTTEERPSALVQFERVVVDAAGCGDWPGLVGRLKRALRGARRDHAGIDLIVRPLITGAEALDWQVRRDADKLLAEAEAEAAAIGTVWIDKIEVDRGSGAASIPAGAMAELAGLVEQRSMSPAALQDAGAAMEALVKALPPLLRDRFGDGDAGRDLALRVLMAEGATDVLARLAGAD